MNEPKISVIVVTYFHENYIRRAIDSILSQSLIDNVEILIGDDGSKDKTLDVLNEYKKKYKFITIFAHENQGLSKNIYNLLINSKGMYIAILEGDDYWIDNKKLEKQIDIIEKNNCLGTACNSLIVDNDGNHLGLWNEQTHLKTGLVSKQKILFYQTAICHPSGIMLKNIFINSNNKYDVIEKASRMGGNHTGMINLIANNGGLFYSEEPLTVWRFIKNENSKNYSSQKHNDVISVYEGMKKYEMYDKVFSFNYERHIYEEYKNCVKALKNELKTSVGEKRYRFAKYEYFVYVVINYIKTIKRKVIKRIKKYVIRKK